MKLQFRNAIVIAACSLLGVAGCGNNAGGEQKAAGQSTDKGEMYSSQGISFEVPAGWKVTADREAEGKGHLVYCEKQGENESGLAYFAIVDSSEDAMQFLYTVLTGTKNSFLNKGGSMDLDPPRDVQLGSFSASLVTYKASIQGMPHSGKAYAFTACGKTVALMMQEADEDHADNEAGMATIERTATCSN